MMPQLRVNGVDLSYIEQGAGAPVVFVHGAWMDLRYWEPQRQVMATPYRFMAYTSRYHGTAPWPDAGQMDVQALVFRPAGRALRSAAPGGVY
jgi:pimeloyl-ACP methyl ester carboxylesterase